MYPSYEARWFFSDPPEGLIAWFASRNMVFYGPKAAKRVDHYLLIDGGTNIGIKLREGNIEAKHLVNSLGERQFPELDIKGTVEYWIKWSFTLDGADEQSQDIIKEGRPHWIDVAKERMAYIYHFREDGEMKEAPLNEQVPEGCQVELTRLLIKNQNYHTFGLEAFSAKGNLEQNLEKGAAAAFSALKAWHEESGWPDDGLGFGEGVPMGYPAFLLGL